MSGRLNGSCCPCSWITLPVYQAPAGMSPIFPLQVAGIKTGAFGGLYSQQGLIVAASVETEDCLTEDCHLQHRNKCHLVMVGV